MQELGLHGNLSAANLLGYLHNHCSHHDHHLGCLYDCDIAVVVSIKSLGQDEGNIM